jgi:hypothetical protein
VIRRISTAVVAFALTAVVAACSTTEPGTPTGTNVSTSPKGSGTSSTSSVPSSTAQPAGANPCDLMSSADLSALGLGAGKRRNIQGTDACLWTASGKFTLSVGYNGSGLGGLAAAQGTDKVAVGKHEAVQVPDKIDPSCGVLIGVSANSTVIVTVTNATGSAGDGCPQAVSIAKIVDPKLP